MRTGIWYNRTWRFRNRRQNPPATRRGLAAARSPAVSKYPITPPATVPMTRITDFSATAPTNCASITTNTVMRAQVGSGNLMSNARKTEKHPSDPKLDAMPNGQVPKDFFGAFSPPGSVQLPRFCRKCLVSPPSRTEVHLAGASVSSCATKKLIPHRLQRFASSLFVNSDLQIIGRACFEAKEMEKHCWNGLLHAPANS